VKRPALHCCVTQGNMNHLQLPPPISIMPITKIVISHLSFPSPSNSSPSLEESSSSSHLSLTRPYDQHSNGQIPRKTFPLEECSGHLCRGVFRIGGNLLCVCRHRCSGGSIGCTCLREVERLIVDMVWKRERWCMWLEIWLIEIGNSAVEKAGHYVGAVVWKEEEQEIRL
jgi:hypothetical protein